GAVALALLLVVLTALAAVRLGELLAAHRERAARAALMAATVWMTCAALGVQTFGVPVATTNASRAAEAQAHRVVDTLRDEAAFAREAEADRFGATPGPELVPDLRGKDVVFTFVESYGRSAIEDPVMAPGVGRTLDASTEALAKAGFHARSGWLTSATYGGSSWLGHSTFLSGLWVDNQQRYRTVTAGDHLTLTKAFAKTGDWDTVGVMPGVRKAWPEADWYGLDTVYDASGLGYRGPRFSWSTMPDQYALEAFQRLEHGRKRARPLMAEVVLTSSHQPWAPVPRMVGWDEVGDGSVYEGIEASGVKASDVITDSARSKEEYGRSIQYSVTSLTQWLERYGTDDTVLVFLGDHQPIARVSGDGASRDVPVSVVARDPKVLDAIDDWHWTEGLKPAHDAPVWRMSSFRDRFLTAYGSTPHPTGAGD
ncbi:CDP-alcohol phosphatidyltransferase, partial [Streptomyces diastaticus]|nr:CDP-alcohol phosphatidyltransferase [Streptomyces diastaticus]